ncbi:hypothetical protein STANM309S_05313 [Streptomyces tanashiensis]
MPWPSREAALAAWARDRVDHRPLPDPAAPARTVAAFFARLGPAGSTRLAARHPLVVGNLNGVPVSLRYHANRITLARAYAAERSRVDDTRLSPEGRHEARRRVDRFASLMRPGRQVLAFDPTGTGRAAEVLGDLERARHVSVIVPGVDTNLLTFQKTHGRYGAPAGMAEALYAAERRASPRARVAVIAWADYTAPVGIGVDAVIGRLAEDGAVRLVGLAESLPRGRARGRCFLMPRATASGVLGGALGTAPAAPPGCSTWPWPEALVDAASSGRRTRRLTCVCRLMTGRRRRRSRTCRTWTVGGSGYGALTGRARSCARPAGRSVRGCARPPERPYFVPGGLTSLAGLHQRSTSLLLVLSGVLLLLTSAVRARGDAQRRLAEQETISEAERARRTLLEERARIARELHDVVAHHMSVITVQADSAPYRIPQLPEAAREEFTSIAASARESLAEMRRLLSVLRSDGSEGERAPQPGLDRVQQLVEATVRAGVPAELRLAADLGEVPQAVDLSAYRIVQEALANVVRHAPGASTRVSVRADEGWLTVLVVNGPSLEEGSSVERGVPGTGHGLVGMRERVRLTGGSLDTGPLPDGGFRVAARLPLRTKDTE